MEPNKELEAIKKALTMIETLDFNKVVIPLEKYQDTETIKFWFGDAVKNVPDKSEIHRAKKETLEKNAMLLGFYPSFYPDAKLGFQKALYSIARRLLMSEQSIYKLRTADISSWLNMPLIGELWANSETLIENYPNLIEWNKKKFKQRKKYSEKARAYFLAMAFWNNKLIMNYRKEGGKKKIDELDGEFNIGINRKIVSWALNFDPDAGLGKMELEEQQVAKELYEKVYKEPPIKT